MKLTCLVLGILSQLHVTAQNIGDYQSASSGDWTTSAATRWDVWDGDSWEDAVSFPNSSSGAIHILSGHNITIGLLSVTANQIVVDAGGLLTINNSLILDDELGIDLEVNGEIALNSLLGTGAGSPNVQINGIFGWSGGTLSVPLVNNAGASLNILGNNKTLTTTLTNNGTIGWTSSQITFNSGTLINNNSFIAAAASSFNHAGSNNLFNNTTGATFRKVSNAGNITFNIPVINAGSIMIEAGTIAITGVNASFTNSGPISYDGGFGFTVSGSAALNTFNAGTNFTGSGTLIISEDLDVNTNLIIPSTITTAFNAASNIIGGSGSLEFNGLWDWNTGTITIPVTITTTGTVTLSVSNTKILSNVLTNNGRINWGGFNLGFNNGTLINNNEISVTGNSAFTHAGGSNSFVNNAGSMFTKILSPGNTIFNIPVNNAGLIDIATGTVSSTTANASLQNSGSIILRAGSSLNVGGTLAGGNSFNAGTNITGDGVINITTNTSINTSLTLPSLVTLNYNGLASTLGGSGSLTINGTMNWGAGTLAVPSALNAGAVLNLVTANKALTTSLNNNGTIDWSAAAINFSNGTLTNNGNFIISGTASNFTITSLTTNSFNNVGTITKTSAGTTGTGSVPFTNSGIININSGIFSKSGSNVIPFVNSGVINIAAGATFNHAIGLNTGAFILDPGTVVNGEGNLILLGNTIVNTALSLPPSVTTDIGSNINIPLVTGTGSVTINGILNWAQGNISIPLTIQPAATLHSTAAKTVGSVLTNNGTIILTDPSTGSISLNNGTIINNGSITDNFTLARQFPNGGGINSFINNGVYNKTNNVSISFNIGVPVTNNSTGVIGGLGSFAFNAGITNTGTIAPGGNSQTGIVSMSTNSVNPPNTPVINIQINNGTGAGTGHDVLEMTGVTTLTGANLVVTETPGAPAQSYTIMTAPVINGFTGSFANANLPAGYTLIIDNTTNPSTVSVVKVSTGSAAPVFTFVPAGVTVQCNNIPEVGTPTATGECAGAITITYLGETINAGTCTDSYSITRTWTASDNCGNSTNASQIITVIDDTDPVFSFVPANISIQCNSAIPEVGSPAASDNCDTDVTITYTGQVITAGSCAESYTITRTWTATDNCGNSETATQTITIADDTDPVFSFVPANVSVLCNTVPAVGIPTATDNCDTDVAILYNGEVITPGSSPDSYTITRSWTATDNCGNTATATQIITVSDNVAPVFSFVPANISVQCSSIPVPGTPTATDNCDASVTIAYLGQTITPGTCPDSYTITRTWTASDDAGNSTNAQQVITVSDVSAPVFSFVPASVSVQCGNVPALISPVATDNCDTEVTIIYHGEEFTPGSCEGSFTLTRTWTAMDNCGNTVNAHQIITVNDNTAPVFNFVPANTTIQCNGIIPAPGVPVASDNCDTEVNITYLGQTIVQGNCPGRYTITRSWTASDDCGNSSNASQVITITDNIAPVMNCIGNAVRTTNAGCTYTVAGQEFDASATDNCGGAGLTYVLTGATTGTGNSLQGVDLNSGVTTITWTAVDECNNSASCSFTVTVNDITKPQITCPVNIEQTANCTALSITVPNPVISDNCTVTTLIWNMTGANTATSPASGINYVGTRMFNPGITTITYTVRDAANNSETCSFTVTINGNTSLPSITCPADVTINASPLLCYGILSDPGTPVTGSGCGSQAVKVYNDHPSIYFPVGVTEITWTAEDANGNKVNCVQKITVIDTQAPLILCPLDRKLNAGQGQCYATNVNIGNTLLAWDNCGIATITNNAPSQFPIGHTVVTWTVTDVNGNSSTCTQDIIVVDATPPVLACPSNISTTAAANTCTKSIAIPDPTATDNCSSVVRLIWTMTGASTGGSPVNGINYVGTKTFNAGITTINYTAFDAEGNSSSCSFTVNVVGAGAPIITCPSNISHTSGSNCSKSIKVPNPTVSSSCGTVASLSWVMTGATTASSSNNGINYVGTRTFNVGTTTITYTARDAGGNSRTCSFNVVITENQKPKVKCPKNVTASANGNSCFKSITIDKPEISDNCSLETVKWVMTGATTGSSPATGINYVGTRNFNVGTTTITYTATDASGNQQTCSITVKVSGKCNMKLNNAYTKTLPQEEDQQMLKGLVVKAYPNPSESGFNIIVNSVNTKEIVNIKVYDIIGRLIHQSKAIPGQTIRFGEKLTAGSYIVEVSQGSEQATIRLSKQ